MWLNSKIVSLHFFCVTFLLTWLMNERALKELVNCPLPMAKPSQIPRFSGDWRRPSAARWTRRPLRWRGCEPRTITTTDRWTSTYWLPPVPQLWNVILFQIQLILLLVLSGRAVLLLAEAKVLPSVGVTTVPWGYWLHRVREKYKKSYFLTCCSFCVPDSRVLIQ